MAHDRPDIAETYLKGLPQLVLSPGLTSETFDCVVLVTDKVENLPERFANIKTALSDYQKIDACVEKEVVLLRFEHVSSKRLIFSPTGPLDRDYDDVRRFADAAAAGLLRARKAGCRKPQFVICDKKNTFQFAVRVALLGALQANYVPYDLRFFVPNKDRKVDTLGLLHEDESTAAKDIEIANIIETGRLVYRDIGGTDPEKMTAQCANHYVNKLMRNTCLQLEFLPDIQKAAPPVRFPLMQAVDRCAYGVERHKGGVIFLAYEGEGPISETLFLVGKGITYDTGGADLKCNGVMAGMHRDKCGAACVAGFFKILSLYKPKGLKVFGAMAMVRNSVGSDAYVADEIITARSGKRVRVGNTDAEGRMVMADVLNFMKEKALRAVNPHLFTIATLTGHVIRAYGPNYTAVMDNGPAHRIQNARKLQEVGDKIGDIFEVSTIRREDYAAHTGRDESEDVLQANNLPSTLTNRGHQNPAAFLVLASGLDAHGNDSATPLKYTHLDIAGSSGPYPGVTTGAPLPALAHRYVFSREGKSCINLSQCVSPESGSPSDRKTCFNWVFDEIQ